MVDAKVLIGVITGEYARRADFYDYFNLLNKKTETLALLCHDRSPAHGRNLVIQSAIDNKCTHILFIDDDMAYKPDSLTKLMEHDLDVVSGLYLSRAYPHQPLIFDVADETGACLPVYLTNGQPRLKPIVAAGLGFILIKTDVFNRLEKPYIRLGELNSEEWCDDIGFFNRLRKAGVESYCDMDVLVGHMGTMIIWPQLDEKGNWMTGYDTNGSGILSTPQMVPQVGYEFVDKSGARIAE